MCSVICQIEGMEADRMGAYETRKTLRVLDEIVLSNSNTMGATEEFIDRAMTLVGTNYHARHGQYLW